MSLKDLANELAAKEKLVERLKMFPETIYPNLPEGFLEMFPDTPRSILPKGIDADEQEGKA